jgi:segregation and condensation protein A
MADEILNQPLVEDVELGDSDGALKYKLQDFEGPLDLLLHLIKEKKKDIMEVSLSEITDQYLAYIQTLKDNDMEVATDFLVVATKLMAIKSYKMLPVEQIEEDTDEMDPEIAFKLNLKEYELFKEAGQNLHDIENVDRFYKAPDKSVGDSRIVFNQFNLDKMLDAFARILIRVEEKENPAPEKKINRDRWTVAEKLSFLKGVLRENKEISFYSLFDNNYSKLEVITVFLAVLELLKFQYAEVIQNEDSNEIIIKAKDIPDVEMNEAVSFDGV